MSSPRALHPEEADPGAVRSLLSEASATALPIWLERRRWFADKGRGISELAIEDALVERVGSDWLALAVARVTFVDSSAARYLLPLALTAAPGDAVVIAGAASGAAIGLVDATEKPWFGGWLLDQFAGATDQARGPGPLPPTRRPVPRSPPLSTVPSRSCARSKATRRCASATS
jgi:maltose alpha-D-glucosyltransferase/alpha-amylase